MSKLILIRGLPGSGKSTLAKYIKNYCGHTYTRWEADAFYDTLEGYVFDPSLIKDAHMWCYTNVVRDIRGDQNVIVSNTFTTNWEMEKYFQLKEKFPDLEIIVINVTTQFDSIHGVPEETFNKMKNRWEDVDPKWGVVVLDYPKDANKLIIKNGTLEQIK